VKENWKRRRKKNKKQKKKETSRCVREVREIKEKKKNRVFNSYFIFLEMMRYQHVNGKQKTFLFVPFI
jgi:hypothetical protein